ncbi:MAG TPA: MarR family transcriptional regulator [Candidatus Borkfalkia avistercoris]|uniref:MarR family transcriptional regulator n=1 Tax=Candidatus Borkfalkia avistercoris TaxID=2838504 RepID=A0A9D2A5J0_9FIRM|nr:MarR family transcriptional regulator [Candidatus Borkfalkia avistercoris]
MARIMRNVGEVWRCANLYRTEEYEALGIGSYQDSYIVDICAHPGVTQEQLSKIMYVHKSNVARQVSSLEEKGFVERRPDPADRRNLLVYPTQKAVAVLDKIRAVHAQWRERLLEGFSEEERAAIGVYLERLAENAKRAASVRRGGER